ncbi:two-component sensor histidine kinase [Terrihabitans soli]|uniref:histidine kinase n=1 Tax=Terrihabitans soli TaxID=708113 RepID=A0A6S6QPP1_9HYPH|nr:HAMP domain-containing sensor histidine kinase [Terrihabitans soli]BCJ90969.1 two-component sensor histidine kinase [Terrihabitans soli]
MPRERSLIGLVATRVTLFAVIAMMIQAVFVLLHYYRNDNRLADLMLDREADALATGFEHIDGRFGYQLPDDLERYAQRRSIARIRLPSGEVLFSNCDTECVRQLLPLDLKPPDSWARLVSQGKPIHVIGGRTRTLEDRTVFIEMGILEDSESVMWAVLGDELADHMVAPMVLLLVFSLGATLLSIRRALQPVSAAAKAAESLDPLNAKSLLTTAGMPREFAELTRAVNRAISRIGDVMRSQKLYTTAIAHEVRVPLAAMKLDLEHIADPRARKIDEDVDRLSHLVTQLTDLGRLDTFDRSMFEEMDLAAIGRHVVADMAPIVFQSGREIGFEDQHPSPALGLHSLIEDAVRNLVHNAMVHTPAGTLIAVIAGPGPLIRITDSAGLENRSYQMPGADGMFRSGDRIGMGLSIVRKIVDLHKGTLSLTVEPGRMTAAEITLPSLPTAS